MDYSTEQWGDEMTNDRHGRKYNDNMSAMEDFERYGSPGEYTDHYYEGQKSINLIEPYEDRSELFQIENEEFDVYRQEELSVNDMNHYNDGERRTARAYRSASEYEIEKYSYDDRIRDEPEVVGIDVGTVFRAAHGRSTAGNSIYDHSAVGNSFFEKSGLVDTHYDGGGSLYEDGTAPGQEYDGDEIVNASHHERGWVTGYDISSVGDTLYDKNNEADIYGKGSVAGTYYNEREYDEGTILDANPNVRRDTFRGSGYDQGDYGHEFTRKSDGGHERHYVTEGNEAAIVSSRRLNLRRQLMAPQPRHSEDSLPLDLNARELSHRRSSSTRSSGKFIQSRQSSSTGRSKRDKLIRRSSRELETNLPPPHKIHSRRNMQQMTPVTEDTIDNVKPIEYLEFTPQSFLEADDDTFCLRTAPLYKPKKQKKKKRVKSRQVSESSSSKDSDTSDDSDSSSRSSSSSCSGDSETISEESRRKSSKRGKKVSRKKARKLKIVIKKERGGKSKSYSLMSKSSSEYSSDSEQKKQTMGGTIYNYLTGADKKDLGINNRASCSSHCR